MRQFIAAAVMIVIVLSLGQAKGGGKKDDFDPAKVRALQAELPAGWKDDTTILDVRRFIKDGKDKLAVYAILHRGAAPASAVELAALAQKEPNLFPHRKWLKTKGIGNLPDGFFIVGQGSVMNSEDDTIGAVRTIEGKTVLFLCVPATDAAARKEMLALVRSVKFGVAGAKVPEAPPDPTKKGSAAEKPGPDDRYGGLVVERKVKLSSLKLKLPKGWDAEHKDGSNVWWIDYKGWAPRVLAGLGLPRDYPRNVDEYAARLEKKGNHFAYGYHLTSVIEKGKLEGGVYVIGKFKMSTDTEGKRITLGFSMYRDLGVEHVFFESFSNDYADAKLLKEAMEIAKSAKF